MEGVRFQAVYTMGSDESLLVTMISEDGTVTKLPLDKSNPAYTAARAAYDEKMAKRSGATKADPESFAGMKLDGGWFKISYEKDLDRCIITFRKKPAEEIRELVKAYGFWWAPSHKCWSRKMNSTAWWAGQELYRKLTA